MPKALHVDHNRAGHAAWQMLTKVPKLTIYFWIIKILTTAMGESTSDYLVNRFNPYLAVAFGGLILLAALAVQFSVRKYIAGVYWVAALAVSISGTMGADVVHVQFGVPYTLSALAYAVILAAVFILWYRSEKTLSIHSVYTRKRELFYWAAVLATFALGTATGDLTAYTMHLGYFTSGLLFAGIFALPALGYWLFRLNPIFSFWFAYIMTRPLGASFADWGGKPQSSGGLGWGDGPVSLVLGILILGFLGYLTVSRKDMQSKHE
jgi:uncharacterized membrane-anchored protein